MCEFCIKHGEGKKWYLNVKNYSEELVNDVNRRAYVKDFFHGVYETEGKPILILNLGKILSKEDK